jgi:hypothetical protein
LTAANINLPSSSITSMNGISQPTSRPVTNQ